jgi:sugar lactone lactonase YvrE
MLTIDKALEYQINGTERKVKEKMTEIQTWTVSKPWLEAHCELGEGPFYEKETNSVRFVDIAKKQILIASLDGGLESLKTIQLDIRTTVTCDIEGVDPTDRILIGVKDGLAILNRKDNSYEIIERFEDSPNARVRSNDGAADPTGRFWLGTMTDFDLGEFQPEGALYSFGAGRKTQHLSKLTIPNSVGFSPDGKTLYFTRTTSSKVLAYDFDLETGEVSNERVFYEHKGEGGPDGFRIDVDGNMWHAIYGESRVIKINTEGQIVGEVKLPTRAITCVQFVGTELIITTASDPDGPDPVSKQYGGAVFRVDVGTRGLEPYKYKL